MCCGSYVKHRVCDRLNLRALLAEFQGGTSVASSIAQGAMNLLRMSNMTMMENISSKLAAVQAGADSCMTQLSYESGTVFCEGWPLNRGVAGVRNEWELGLDGNVVQQDNSSSSEHTNGALEDGAAAEPASGMKRKAGSRHDGKSKELSKVGDTATTPPSLLLSNPRKLRPLLVTLSACELAFFFSRTFRSGTILCWRVSFRLGCSRIQRAMRGSRQNVQKQVAGRGRVMRRSRRLIAPQVSSLGTS